MKAIEIERRFLVRDGSWRAVAASSQLLLQAYLSKHGKTCVRVRLIDGRSASLTIKFRVIGLIKEEYEYEIPVAEALELLQHMAGGVIEKTRHRVICDGKHWEVDVFGGAYQGLTIAEIEMPNEADELALPGWIGKEVTGDRRYSNSSMASALRAQPLKPP